MPGRWFDSLESRLTTKSPAGGRNYLIRASVYDCAGIGDFMRLSTHLVACLAFVALAGASLAYAGNLFDIFPAQVATDDDDDVVKVSPDLDPLKNGKATDSSTTTTRPATTSTPDPLEDPDAFFRRNGAVYPAAPGQTHKRNVVYKETLFDGEHQHPYEDPFTLKRLANFGSWSLEPDVLFGWGVGNDDDGFGLDFHGRVKYGPLGIDGNFMLTAFDDTPMAWLGAARFLLDLDIYQWLNIRPMLGLFQMDFKDQPNDHGSLIGIETEIWPYQPLTIGASFQAYLTEERNVIRDGYIYVGFIPTLLDEGTYPKWFPEIRIGWRRMVGERGTINDNMIVIQFAVEF